MPSLSLCWVEPCHSNIPELLSYRGQDERIAVEEGSFLSDCHTWKTALSPGCSVNKPVCVCVCLTG